MQTVPIDPTTQRKLTVAEVADMHRIDRGTVYRFIASGELPAEKVGKQYRINEADARALAKPVAA